MDSVAPWMDALHEERRLRVNGQQTSMDALHEERRLQVNGQQTSMDALHEAAASGE